MALNSLPYKSSTSLQRQSLNKRTKKLAAIGGAYVLIAYGVYQMLPIGTFNQISNEDGIIESLGALWFATGCIIFFLGFSKIRQKSQPSQFAKYYYFLFGLFLFLCLMEEISWGQRILGIKTPAFVEEVNHQKEINIHNLEIFTNINSAFSSQSIFTGVWFVLCILIPLANRYNRVLQGFVLKKDIPMVSLSIGSIFLLNYLLSKMAYAQKYGLERLLDVGPEIVEMRESNFAFLYMIVALEMYGMAMLDHSSREGFNQ